MFDESIADTFKEAGYNPQLIWFDDQGGEWQLWLYPQRALAFSKNFCGQSVAEVVDAALDFINNKPGT